MILQQVDSLIDSWVRSHQTSIRALSLYRILFASYAILFGLKRFAWVADYPGGLWRPPFPFSLFDTYGTFAVGLYAGPMPDHVLISLEGVLCLLFVLLLFGVWTPYTSALITVLLILLNWQVYSLPKTNHDILFCVTPLIMSLSGWGRALSFDAGRIRRLKTYPSLCLFLLAVIITTGFAVAGLPKLVHWVDFDLSTSGVRMWVTGIYFSGGEGGGPLSAWLAYITNPLFWEALDFAAVIFELGFLIAVFQQRLFRMWMGLAVVFHFSNYLMLGIPFFFNVPVYAAFLPWERISQLLKESRLEKSILGFSGYTQLFRVSLFVAVLIAAEVLYFVRPAIGLHRTGWMQLVQVFVVFGGAFSILLYLAFSKTQSLPATVQKSKLKSSNPKD